MRITRIAANAIFVAFIFCAASWDARGQAAPALQGESSSAATRPAKLADVAWLSGHWVGSAGENTTDEVCAQPTNEIMTCMFHVGHAGKTLWLEFDTYYDTPEGLVEHIIFLTPELQQFHLPVASLHGRAAAPDKVVFESSGGQPKSITLTLNAASGFVSRVEFAGADGKSSFHDNSMHRAP